MCLARSSPDQPPPHRPTTPSHYNATSYIATGAHIHSTELHHYEQRFCTHSARLPGGHDTKARGAALHHHHRGTSACPRTPPVTRKACTIQVGVLHHGRTRHGASLIISMVVSTTLGPEELRWPQTMRRLQTIKCTNSARQVSRATYSGFHITPSWMSYILKSRPHPGIPSDPCCRRRYPQRLLSQHHSDYSNSW